MSKLVPILTTIFDRNESQWWDSLLIQEFKGKVFKFLDLKKEDLEKYIEITNDLDGLEIIMDKPFTNNKLDIKQVQVRFHPIDTWIYQASIIKWIGNHVWVHVLRSKYVAWQTLWEFWSFDKPTRVKGDLQDYIASICEYIERSLSYSSFDKTISFFRQISPVNIKITSLEDGVLNLIVTDIWSSIWKMIDTSED